MLYILHSGVSFKIWIPLNYLGINAIPRTQRPQSISTDALMVSMVTFMDLPHTLLFLHTSLIPQANKFDFLLPVNIYAMTSAGYPDYNWPLFISRCIYVSGHRLLDCTSQLTNLSSLSLYWTKVIFTPSQDSFIWGTDISYGLTGSHIEGCFLHTPLIPFHLLCEVGSLSCHCNKFFPKGTHWFWGQAAFP